MDVTVFLAFTLAVGPFVAGLGGYIGQYSLFQSIIYMGPEVVEGAPWLLWNNVGIAAWESPVRSFLAPLLLVIVTALVIALYERCLRDGWLMAVPHDPEIGVVGIGGTVDRPIVEHTY